MHRKSLIALLGATIIAVALAGSAFAAHPGPAVHVQIKTLKRTVRQAVVHGERGWITKGRTPRGKCPGDSAAGALTAATHGRWTGRYYASLHDIFITSILGVRPKGNAYWALYVNGKPSSRGACEIRLRPGQRLVFRITK